MFDIQFDSTTAGVKDGSQLSAGKAGLLFVKYLQYLFFPLQKHKYLSFHLSMCALASIGVNDYNENAEIGSFLYYEHGGRFGCVLLRLIMI